ncbi:MAG: cardiolipin synthase [Gemmatimonadetes bacterium]|nr:cardiolipin synthase [Gemmatimonadota bacterium]
MIDSLFGHPWWLLLFAGVGAAAVAGAVITLFFALGRRPQKFTTTAAPPVTSRDFLLTVAGTVNAPVSHGGRARLLNNGVQIFPAMLDAIRNAKHSVNFMVYIWEPGRTGDAFMEAFCERAGAGVEVRVMLDAFGGFGAPGRTLKRLREAGVKVLWFRRFRFGKLTRFYRRNHRRAIVIDGVVAFTGGAAVADKWQGDADSPDHWRDLMVEVTGRPAAHMQSAFAQLWTSVCGEVLAGERFFPRHPEDEEAPRAGDVEVFRHVNVISSPADESHPLRKVFWMSFRCARERIWITTPYFVPDRETRRVIEDRARAGVDVRLLLPGRRTDAWPIRLASHSYYHELLAAGVRIYEYQPTMMHSKALVVDGAWSIIGSANLDVRSKELNQENVIGMLDRALGRQVEDTFRADLERCTEIRLEEWRRRGIVPRILERFFVLFAEQY